MKLVKATDGTPVSGQDVTIQILKTLAVPVGFWLTVNVIIPFARGCITGAKEVINERLEEEKAN